MIAVFMTIRRRMLAVEGAWWHPDCRQSVHNPDFRIVSESAVIAPYPISNRIADEDPHE
jgi:hypothetical protein